MVFPWFPMIFPWFPYGIFQTAQDLPKGGQCGRRPAGIENCGDTIGMADEN